MPFSACARGCVFREVYPPSYDRKGDTPMKMVVAFLLTMCAIVGLLFFGAVNPPKAQAVPSYARQTGLACSGCHYTPPELNPAGRRFKLLGYVDKADDAKVVKTDSGKKKAPLDLLAS